MTQLLTETKHSTAWCHVMMPPSGGGGGNCGPLVKNYKYAHVILCAVSASNIVISRVVTSRLVPT